MKAAYGFAVVGPLIMLLGAYVAGGTTVVCTRTGAPAESADPRPAVVGSCRVQTTRWFGRTVVEERTYPRVTGADRIAVASTSSSGPRRTDSWYLQLMSGAVEVERIGGPRDRVDPAHDAARAWFDGAAASPLTLDLTEWRFAYAAIGFGTLWLGVVSLIARSGSARSARRRRRRVQPT